jgi:predicted ArsR family transcriptional regulator
MISVEEIRALTARQREVLTLVVENKLYKNRETDISELATELGVAPSQVYRHLIEIERSDLLKVVVAPSLKATQFYERMRLEAPEPRRHVTTEALSDTKRDILLYLDATPDVTMLELSEELHISDSSVSQHLRVLETIGFVRKSRSKNPSPSRRGVPPYIFNITPHGRTVLTQFRPAPGEEPA